MSPLYDYLAAVQACLRELRAAYVGALLGALVVTWWIYVPVHELLHAFGCWVTGGTVTRLDIAPEYGAALLKRFFPFIHVGSEYAGRLSGFDTHGSDLVYLATDFAPFLLTVFIGVPLLRAASRLGHRPLLGCMALGASIPVAYAPFISVMGDYYEMGSILVSGVAAQWSPGFDPQRWRSDDLVKLAGHLFSAGGSGTGADALGLAASLLLGIVLIFDTYWLGVAWSRVIFSPLREGAG